MQKYYDAKGSKYRAAQSAYAHPVRRMMHLKQHGVKARSTPHRKVKSTKWRDMNLIFTCTSQRLQNIWNTVHENFMVFYNVFVAFVGLNNNTIVYAQYRIWIGLVWPIPRSGRKCQYWRDTDTEYQIGAPLSKTGTKIPISLLKGLVHPKMKILSITFPMTFQTRKSFVRLWTQIKIFLTHSDSSLTLPQTTM